jgi:hypothetical protein
MRQLERLTRCITTMPWFVVDNTILCANPIYSQYATGMKASGTMARSILSGNVGALICDCAENKHVAAVVLLILGFTYKRYKNAH